MIGKLNASQKYTILKAYFASPMFSLERKHYLRTKALEGDSSDKAINCSKVCDYSLPDAELKERLWNEIMEPNTIKDYSLNDLKNKISGFENHIQQLELMEPFHAKYYANIN